MKKRFSEEQVIGILREGETDGAVIRDICRKHNITEQTFFRWRNKFGGIDRSPLKLGTPSSFLSPIFPAIRRAIISPPSYPSTSPLEIAPLTMKGRLAELIPVAEPTPISRF